MCWYLKVKEGGGGLTHGSNTNIQVLKTISNLRFIELCQTKAHTFLTPDTDVECQVRSDVVDKELESVLGRSLHLDFVVT